LDGSGNVLLSRRFSTVERRVRLRHDAALCSEEKGGNNYFPYHAIRVPNDEEFSTMFRDDFLDHFHHSSSPEYPIFGLQRRKKGGRETATPASDNAGELVLWPTVMLHRLGVFLVAVPEVDGFPIAKVPEQRPRAIQLPCVTAAFALLESLVSVISPCAPAFESDNLAIVQCQISSMMPFGTPLETDAQVINEIHAKGFKDSETNVQKRPAWKPYILLKENQKLRLHVQEEVLSMQYGRDGVDDVWKLSGRITCDAHLNGVPRVSLPLNNAAMLTDLIVDNCALPPAEIDSKLIIFTPPNRGIELCRYNFQLPAKTKLPLHGTYHVTERTHSQVQVDLKLCWGLKDQFKGLMKECSVRLPWKNKCRVAFHNLTASHGAVVMATKENVLVWTLGKRFIEQGQDGWLRGTVTFAAPVKKSPATVPATPAPSLVGAGIDTGICTGDETTVPLASFARSGARGDAAVAVLSDDVLPTDGGAAEPAPIFRTDRVEEVSKAYVSLPGGQGYDTFSQNKLEKLEARSTWKEYAADDLDGSESGLTTPQRRRRKDPMLVGSNCYAQVHFHVSNYTLSGLMIDRNAVSIEPSSQGAAISIEADVRTSEFLIWNSGKDEGGVSVEARYAVSGKGLGKEKGRKLV
jgi:hypothetical protein